MVERCADGRRQGTMEHRKLVLLNLSVEKFCDEPKREGERETINKMKKGIEERRKKHAQEYCHSSRVLIDVRRAVEYPMTLIVAPVNCLGHIGFEQKYFRNYALTSVRKM